MKHFLSIDEEYLIGIEKIVYTDGSNAAIVFRKMYPFVDGVDRDDEVLFTLDDGTRIVEKAKLSFLECPHDVDTFVITMMSLIDSVGTPIDESNLW